MRRVITAIVVGAAAVLGLGAGFVGFVAAPTAAVAEAPFSITDRVTDRTGQIGSRAVDVRQAISTLEEETGARLWVVVVNSFDSAADGFAWSSDVAERSGLGDEDVILYVGMQSEDFGLNAPSALPLSDAKLRDIERNDILPSLNRGDIAQAAINAADGLRTQLSESGSGTGGLAGPSGSGTSGSGTSGTSTSTVGDGTAGAIALGVGGVAVAGLVGTSLVMGRRRKKREREAIEARDLKERQELELLGTRASQSLVQLDDTIKAAEQDLGFAQAQFGDTPLAAFRAAIEDAKAKAKEAFGLQSQVLDHIPDTPQQHRDWNTRILELTGQAQSAIRASGSEFDRLRELSKNVPATLEQLTARAEEAGPRIDAAERTLAELGASYAPAALRSVRDAPQRARDRLAFAVDRAEDAAAAMKSGRAGESAVFVRDADEALGQVDQIVASVEQAQRDLGAAGDMIRDEIADMERDLARLDASPAASAGREAGAAARTAIAQAKAPDALTRDPLGALAALREANQRLDVAVKGVVDAEQRLGELARRLERSLAQARAQISSGLSYLSSNRGGVGSSARARFTQAEAELSTAEQLRASDPEQALAHADQANALAERAMQLAQSDVESAMGSLSGGGYGGGYRSPYGGYVGGSSDLGSAIIGGIIGGMLTGGGSSRRSGGGYGGGFGGGFSSSGGFRSGGGGFGGGFGSSGGGRRR